MFRPGSTLKRWVIVTVAAYAMVLHALAMGAASAGTVTGSLQICQGLIGGDQQLPDAPSVHSAPCALCGLGHAAIDTPRAHALAPPVNIFETVALNGTETRIVTVLEFLSSSRPRAPPVFM
jgi:hypothetical protein